jgi:hypothetical protein
MLVAKPQGPILTRLDTFLRPKLIRYMVAQRENRFDLGAVMNEGKIFLAKLSQGAIGEENAYLLGTLLVSKFQQLAMSRQQTAVAQRRNFYLYIDEFHNFVTPSMAAILSGARKYRLGLILAHQELQQLASRDADVASAVIANPYTRICFRLGDFDAKRLADGFSFFEAKDLQNLQVGEAICRVERAEFDFNLKTLPLPSIDRAEAERRRERIIALSRERYATPRAVVEAALMPEEIPPPVQISRPQHPAAEPPPRATPSVSEEKRPPAPPSARAKLPSAPSSSGRGGPQHKYIQELVRRWASSRGYKTTIEKEILDGLGSVDVALEKDGRSIACEISITTTVEHEMGNVQKCLTAGFEHVVLILSERKMMAKAKDAVAAAVSEAERARVHVLTTEEFFAFVETLEAHAAGREEKVLGYKVKVDYQPVAEGEQKARKQAISQVILGALKKLKGDRK